MSSRGRGLLEIKPSSNPFFQSTGSDIGVNPHIPVKWTGDVDPAMTRVNPASKDTFSFLYTRESDTIGSKVAKPQNEHPQILTKTEFLKKRREELRTQMLLDSGGIDPYATEGEAGGGLESTKPNVEEILSRYTHAPKQEDPRYMTTAVSPCLAPAFKYHFMIHLLIYVTLIFVLYISE